MKKILLTIATGVLFGSMTMAQYDPTLWVVLDETEQVTALTGLTQANGIQEGGAAAYTKTWNGDVLEVNFVFAAGNGKNYNDFSLQFCKWKGGGVDGAMTGKYFTKDTSGVDQASDIAIGYTVDMTEEANRYVTMEVQASDALTLRLDLGDIAGKLSNASSPIASIAQTTDNTVWTPVTFSWNDDSEGLGADANATEIADQYTGDWWNIGSTNDYDARKCSYLRGGANTKVAMDVDKIVKLALTIDNETELATDKTLKIRNIKVGTGTAVVMDMTDIETISGAALEVVDGVIYSGGAITVTNVAGQVVKVADKTLEISSLPAGVLVITAAEGTAKIVK
ncbi:MAG: hypothetical protein BWY22_01980 [Bacteroidetes bacterium ADurb.Bin217]|nr:MAG: hypothetical protein BWY22_01980 [Bacteroidetes bacterium ADurb.Bin217]